MCTAVLGIEPGLPVLLAGVRDELTDRPWKPPGPHWPRYPDLVGGLDLQAGGTWLAVSPSRLRVSCVLNGVGRPAPPARRRSRGELPLLAAAGEQAGQRGLADYDPFHLVVAEPERAVLRSWDGSELAEHELSAGLHFIVNSGHACVPSGAARPGTPQPGTTRPCTARPGSGSAGVPDAAPAGGCPDQDWAGPKWRGTPPPDGRDHELARTAYFLDRFRSAVRPEPKPGQPVADAWGAWFPLVNGDGIEPGDQRALIVRRDLGGGRTWGTSSISLVALAPGWLRYDFTARPGDETSWRQVL